MNGLTRIDNHELAMVSGGVDIGDILTGLLEIGTGLANYAADNGAFDSPFWSDTELVGNLAYSALFAVAFIGLNVGSALGAELLFDFE